MTVSVHVKGVLCALAMIVSGCAATPTSIRTNVELTMFIEQDDSTTLYRVDRDGTIGFAGGLDARMGTITWQDALTDDEIVSLESLLDAPFWRERHRAAGRLRSGERRFTVAVRGDQLRSRVVAVVEPGAAAPDEIHQLERMLRSAASRRIEQDLPRFSVYSARNSPPSDLHATPAPFRPIR